MTSSESRSSPGGSLGFVLVGVGVLAVLLAGRIDWVPLTENHDPGPRAFPLGLGYCLVLGGVFEWVRSLVEALRRSRQRQEGELRDTAKVSTAIPRKWWSDRGVHDAVLLIVALGVYIPAISFLGFSLSTVLFAGGMMLRLGARWWLAAMMSLILVAVIHLLFVVLFKVQLPVGALGLPF